MGDDVIRDAPSDPFKHHVKMPVILVLMGVSGSGKTTIARLLASALGCPFQEGDDFHPAANIEKMASGTPLTDADRLPWLNSIAALIDNWRAAGQCGVLTCSALKKEYRDILIGGRTGVIFIYLQGSYDLIRERMEARKKHFMPLDLLKSQFETLQEPVPGSQTIRVSVDNHPDAIVQDILRQLEKLQLDTEAAGRV
ncbi:MAG: gluconokinase [Rhodobacterales bacterium]|nr:gluconokinase [Rhodobacterales bacterium]